MVCQVRSWQRCDGARAPRLHTKAQRRSETEPEKEKKKKKKGTFSNYPHEIISSRKRLFLGKPASVLGCFPFFFFFFFRCSPFFPPVLSDGAQCSEEPRVHIAMQDNTNLSCPRMLIDRPVTRGAPPRVPMGGVGGGEVRRSGRRGREVDYNYRF